MDKVISFFTDFYKDPLFSIIIILSIIILVAIADYTRNRFKLKEKEDSLKIMAENLNFYEFDKNLNDAINFSKTPQETLIFIAKIYVQSGNFDDAIKIYLAILDKTSELKAKIEIFELLGIAYYKAGFMQRAKGIFIEILKHNPRNTNALMLLMQTYETLGEYSNALEVVSCLEEVESGAAAVDKAKLENVKNYIKMLVLVNDSLMSSALREREILKAMVQGGTKIALQYFLQHNIRRFWEIIMSEKNLHNYVDLLWHLPPPQNMETIKSHKQIADIYRAKGQLNDNEECEIFELEVLRILGKDSSKKADLGFKYRCDFCGGSFPFESHRCPNCAEVGGNSVVLEILEKQK